VSHFLTVPVNENGIIFDVNIDKEIQCAAANPFANQNWLIGNGLCFS